jgi:hypothetical protein
MQINEHMCRHWLTIKRGAYLRNFAELLSEHLNRKLITQAMAGQADDYEL